MQINKTVIKTEFDKFIDTISYYPNSDNNSNIASFSFEIPVIEIVTLLTSNIIRIEDNFYWKIKNQNIEFLASSPLINFNEFGEDRLSKTSANVNRIEKNFRSNWHENGLEKIPLIVGGIKFAPNQNSNLWQNFSDSDWFIPKFLFYKRDGKLFLIYNFIVDHNSEQNRKSFAEFLTTLESLTEKETSDSEVNKLKSPIYSNSVDRWEIIVNEALKEFPKEC